MHRLLFLVTAINVPLVRERVVYVDGGC